MPAQQILVCRVPIACSSTPQQAGKLTGTLPRRPDNHLDRLFRRFSCQGESWSGQTGNSSWPTNETANECFGKPQKIYGTDLANVVSPVVNDGSAIFRTRSPIRAFSGRKPERACTYQP